MKIKKIIKSSKILYIEIILLILNIIFLIFNITR